MEENLNKIIHGDCLIEMQKIPDKSIDMILCDLPYGTTACKWDTIIPFEPLWEQYKRIIKDNGAIVLTASQPFTSALVMSNPSMFRHNWIWEKSTSGNFMSFKYQPQKRHEDILVFGKNKVNYYPIKYKGEKSHRSKPANCNSNVIGLKNNPMGVDTSDIKNPLSIIKIMSRDGKSKIHPTQKPVALFEYLIKTYTSVGDVVLDNTAGSGTTGVACKNLNRNFILIEQDEKYCEVIKERVGCEII
jgi:site-specific DNA-methyltransferase (adenine-specific)